MNRIPPDILRMINPSMAVAFSSFLASQLTRSITYRPDVHGVIAATLDAIDIMVAKDDALEKIALVMGFGGTKREDAKARVIDILAVSLIPIMRKLVENETYLHLVDEAIKLTGSSEFSERWFDLDLDEVIEGPVTLVLGIPLEPRTSLAPLSDGFEA